MTHELCMVRTCGEREERRRNEGVRDGERKCDPGSLYGEDSRRERERERERERRWRRRDKGVRD